jgi:hypothetical protein
MTISEARTALNGGLKQLDMELGECAYFQVTNAPGRVLVMVVDAKVVRVERQDTLGRTDRGARVGDSEARIDSLYRGLINVEPHHYTWESGGHYLVVTPKNMADTLHRMIFETDGKKVTEFRSGILPPVRWVEGCA